MATLRPSLGLFAPVGRPARPPSLTRATVFVRTVLTMASSVRDHDERRQAADVVGAPASLAPVARTPQASPVATATAPSSKAEGVFVVIAAYREAQVISEVVNGLRERWPNVVVVDDGSDDATAELAGEAGAFVLRHVINRGQGAALQTGIAYALRCGAEVVVTFDADGQHPSTAIDDLLAPIASGVAEVALGSRFLGHSQRIPWMRRCLIRAAVLFTRLSTGARVTDAHNGLRAFSRSAAATLNLRLDRMAHASEIIDQVLRAQLPYVEVPVAIEYTAYSRAKGQAGTAAFRILWDYMLSKVVS